METMGAATGEITAREELYEFLSKDPALAVYFIGDLDPRYFEKCRWWAHRDSSGAVDALVLLYNHPVYPTILPLGSARGVAGILDEQRSQWPARFHTHLPPAHVPAFEDCCRLSSKEDFLRMALKRDDAVGCRTSQSVTRLTRADEGQVRDLLAEYPEGFFCVDDLDSGFYFGVYRDGVLAAMSGIHVVSPEHRVAALGNIVTRAALRRQGLATLCTAHLLRELFKVVDVAALNVKEANVAAIRVYERLGFRTHSKLVVGYAEQMDSGG